MQKTGTALIVSRFRDLRPDTLNLQKLEQKCLACGAWKELRGPVLFLPIPISTRLYAALHLLARPLLRWIKIRSAVISLGLPYRHYLFGKTFPYLAFATPLRVLWTYDVWEPRFDEFAKIVREARIDLLLLTSRQATEYFRKLNLPGCGVHWVPECLEVSEYQRRPWADRAIDILSFGRGHSRYHDSIAGACAARGLRYVYQRFETADELIEAMGNAKISICFPQAMTHPERAGAVSTVTLRYLQSMASKCLIVGSSPLEAEEMFGHNPVVEVNWNDPVGQLEQILREPCPYLELIEKNFAAVSARHQTSNFVERVDLLIAACDVF